MPRLKICSGNPPNPFLICRQTLWHRKFQSYQQTETRSGRHRGPIVAHRLHLSSTRGGCYTTAIIMKGGMQNSGDLTASVIPERGRLFKDQRLYHEEYSRHRHHEPAEFV